MSTTDEQCQEWKLWLQCVAIPSTGIGVQCGTQSWCESVRLHVVNGEQGDLPCRCKSFRGIKTTGQIAPHPRAPRDGDEIWFCLELVADTKGSALCIVAVSRSLWQVPKRLANELCQVVAVGVQCFDWVDPSLLPAVHRVQRDLAIEV